jgi:hypothetical protein
VVTVTTNRRRGTNAAAAIKVACIAASTANVSLVGEQTIDGIALVEGDRVLLKNQTDGTENGIWLVSTGAWVRASDWNGEFDVVEGTIVPVSRGTANADSEFRVTNTDTITIGTTDLTFARRVANTSNFEDIFWGTTIADDGSKSNRLIQDAANTDLDWYISRGVQYVGGQWQLAVAGDSPTGVFFNGDSTTNGLVVVAAGNHNSLAAGADVGSPADFPAVLELSGLSGIARLSTNGTTRLTVNDTEVIIRDQLRMSSTEAPILASAMGTGGGAIRIPHGTAPSSPTDGDFWTTTAGFYGRVNGSTVGPFTGGGISISGTPANNQLAVWTDANTIEGEADITYDQTTFTLANHVAMQLPSAYRIQFDNANYHINGQASKIQVAGTNFETEFDATIGAGGVGTSQLNVNANATGTTYLNFKQNSVIKGYLGYENTGAQMKLDSDGQIILSPNNTTAVTLATTGAATFAGTIIAPASTTSVPSLRLPHGSAPTSPTDGDMWTTTAGLYVRINGTTVGPLT